MKYIIIEEFGIDTPILFPDHLGHNTFCGLAIISAGFFTVGKDKSVACFGVSDSLRKESRSCDAAIIERWLKGGDQYVDRNG